VQSLPKISEQLIILKNIDLLKKNVLNKSKV